VIVSHPNKPKCSDEPELWFSDDRADKVRAKAICLTCPLLAECRDYGKTQEYGIWGGVEAKPTPEYKLPTVAQVDRDHRDSRIRTMILQNYTVPEIAVHLNITPRTVERVRSRLNVA
jgi:hypothetical protein